MKTLLHKSRHTGYLLLLLTFTVSFSWGQGLEDFTNSSATNSYADGSFVGNDGITWTYVASRDGNADENGSGINLPALMLRRVANNSKVTSTAIPNGIGDFSVKLYKGFTGNGDRQVELFVNGTSQGISNGFDDNNEHVFEVVGIDISGDVIIEIKNITSRQVIIDDISWTSFGGGANTAPFITNITQNPTSNNVTSSNPVSVSADLVDSDGIASAELYWGTTSGTLTNTIAMGLTAGETYTTVSAIPAQADGTTVYYEIQATDSNAAPLSTTSPEQTYTVEDPIPFDLPYFNGFRNQIDLDDAIGYGFAFNNATLTTSAGGYMKIENGSITSPAIDFSAYDDLTVVFDMTTFGGAGAQELSVLVSNDNGATYNSAGTFTTPAAYESFIQFIDLSSMNSVSGRIKFEMTGGTNSIRFRDLSILPEFQGYIYANQNWSPSSPNGVSTATDDLYIINGTATLSADTDVRNITINSVATLKVEKVLNAAGNITNKGKFIFISTATANGELGPMSGTVTGSATVQRYMSDKRSYRMVSSAVTTSTSIMNNWQEGVNNLGTDFPGDNLDPNPGFGTHITGSTSGANGFDATLSGNASMFLVDMDTQEFVTVNNTDTNTLNAGDGYMLFVRGDRGTDLSDNDATPSATVLRATGSLMIGSDLQNFATVNTNDFAMFGNPYQSVVDVNSVMAGASNVNATQYYVYDPSLATNGAYVTVDLPSGENTFNSVANQYLQPGQGAQFATLGAGVSSLVFNESDKAPGNFTTTNSNSNRLSADDMLTFQLYTTENFDNAGPVHDSFGIIFADGNDNGLTMMDAVKPMNFDENFGIDHNGTYLSIERRAMPVQGEVYSLYSSGYKNSQYTVKIIMDGLEEMEIYLDDQYTEGSTLLEQGELTYGFEVNENNPESMATDRFSVRVENRLGVSDNSLLAGIQLYPNPLYGNSFYINAPKLNGEEVSISINDMLGREVYSMHQTFSGNSLNIDLSQELKSGVYLVTLSSNGENKSLRIIKR